MTRMTESSQTYNMSKDLLTLIKLDAKFIMVT